jgi:ribosomal protein S18 acetylase RimI-like enzyme
MNITEIKDENLKSQYSNEVLQELPEWFGNENSLCQYASDVRKFPYWAAFDENGKCIGFISIKTHYDLTGDIYVIGILPEYHREGIGRKLYASAEEYLILNKYRYVIVKTLSEKAQYEPYEKTRKFYLSIGFEPLITLTEMWDEENPCLIMIKVL